MALFPRRSQVGKVDSFGIKIPDWLGEEICQTLTVTAPQGGVSVGASEISGSILRVLLTGLTVGVHELHFDYTTATRSRLSCVKVVVVDGDC